MLLSIEICGISNYMKIYRALSIGLHLKKENNEEAKFTSGRAIQWWVFLFSRNHAWLECLGMVVYSAMHLRRYLNQNLHLAASFILQDSTQLPIYPSIAHNAQKKEYPLIPCKNSNYLQLQAHPNYTLLNVYICLYLSYSKSRCFSFQQKYNMFMKKTGSLASPFRNCKK